MNKQFILLVLLSLAIFQAHSREAFDEEFKEFRSKHGKTYSEHEARYRMQIYLKNKNKITAHNSDPSKTWQMGSTKFSDLSH